VSWLRLDDSFVDNGKIGELSDGELRVWLRVLCHCARAQDPTVDPITIRAVSGLTRRVLMKLLKLELLDEIGTSGYEVHHWAQYQSRRCRRRRASRACGKPVRAATLERGERQGNGNGIG
jgi:hypothetical protein